MDQGMFTVCTTCWRRRPLPPSSGERGGDRADPDLVERTVSCHQCGVDGGGVCTEIVMRDRDGFVPNLLLSDVLFVFRDFFFMYYWFFPQCAVVKWIDVDKAFISYCRRRYGFFITRQTLNWMLNSNLVPYLGHNIDFISTIFFDEYAENWNGYEGRKIYGCGFHIFFLLKYTLKLPPEFVLF